MKPATFPWVLTLALAGLVAAGAGGQEGMHPIAEQVKAQLKDPDRPFTMAFGLNIKDGAREKFEASFAKAIRGTRKEKGVLVYELNRDAKDPNRYLLYERWKTLADLDAHLKTPYITTLLSDLKELLAGDPELKVLLPAGE